MSQKSLCVTYFLWLIGGFFGLHHMYLRRDRHAFLMWSTAAGFFGLGLIRDVWRIPEYVKDANEDPTYMEKLRDVMRKKKKPPYGFFRQMAQVAVGNVWGWTVQLAIPEEDVFGVSLSFLEILIPFAIALGVHTVGNVGRIQGAFHWALLGAFLMPILKFWDIDGMSLAAFASSSLFEAKSAQWRRKPLSRHGILRRVTQIWLCALFYSTLWSSFLYFNAEVTDSSGESIKFRDGVSNFLTSPLWTDFKRTFIELFNAFWNQGWRDTWQKLMNELDPFGEQQAYKVLGVASNAKQEEITAQWRKLSREWHPDRFMDEDKKREAQNKFMEFNAAYETLSKIKTRRAKKNKSFQDY